jgi:FMN phosphatase YigB (HAD superfamily)
LGPDSFQAFYILGKTKTMHQFTKFIVVEEMHELEDGWRTTTPVDKENNERNYSVGQRSKAESYKEAMEQFENVATDLSRDAKKVIRKQKEHKKL